MSQTKHLTSADPYPGKKDTLRVYNMRHCPYPHRVLLVLAHKQIKHELVNINSSDKPNWFFELNPRGTVPALEIGDKVLYESVGCMDYLDEAYPGPTLTPSDPYIKAKGNILFEAFSSMVVAAYYKLLYGEKAKISEAIEALRKVLEDFEKLMPETKFLTGDTVSMVDYKIWPLTDRMNAVSVLLKTDILSKERYPKFVAWFERMDDTPGVKATKVPLQELVTFFQTSADFAFNK